MICYGLILAFPTTTVSCISGGLVDMAFYLQKVNKIYDSEEKNITVVTGFIPDCLTNKDKKAIYKALSPLNTRQVGFKNTFKIRE